MKTYKETKEAYRQLVLTIGINNILGMHHNQLRADGHTSSDIYKAQSYFLCSPQAAKYR